MQSPVVGVMEGFMLGANDGASVGSPGKGVGRNVVVGKSDGNVVGKSEGDVEGQYDNNMVRAAVGLVVVVVVGT